MLIGEFSSRIGVKKRVAVPKSFREQMGDQLIVTRGYEGCLVLVDHVRFDELTKEVVEGSFIDRKVRDTGRFLLAGAHEVELDAQGRFVIPNSLFMYASFDKEAVFIGLGNWVEMWSGKAWEEQEDFIRENGSAVAQELAEIAELRSE